LTPQRQPSRNGCSTAPAGSEAERDRRVGGLHSATLAVLVALVETAWFRRRDPRDDRFGLGAINIPTFLLAEGDDVITDVMVPLRLETSGDVEGPGGQTYPSDLRWSWETDGGRIGMHIDNVEMIEALDMEPTHKGLAHAVFGHFEHRM
jgi:hypothetical protein